VLDELEVLELEVLELLGVGVTEGCVEVDDPELDGVELEVELELELDTDEEEEEEEDADPGPPLIVPFLI